ncbi:MAG: exodeoxyribonuclease VII large subunit, partial [Thermodesulfobacteriota bacterium]|nr:exodeoxyribonuclease VII large subunit [Thermodesulfobacteriota bacterium]
LKSHLTNMNQRLLFLSKGLRDPRKRIADSWMRLDELNSRLIRLISQMIKEYNKHLVSEGRTLLLHSPKNLFSFMNQSIDFQKRSLALTMIRRLKDHQKDLSLFETKIKDLSPFSVLKRGYSITRKLPEKMILKDVSGIKRGDNVNVILAQGEIECRIEKIEPSGRISTGE